MTRPTVLRPERTSPAEGANSRNTGVHLSQPERLAALAARLMTPGVCSPHRQATPANFYSGVNVSISERLLPCARRLDQKRDSGPGNGWERWACWASCRQAVHVELRFGSSVAALQVPETETLKTNSADISFQFSSPRLLQCERLLMLLVDGRKNTNKHPTCLFYKVLPL